MGFNSAFKGLNMFLLHVTYFRLHVNNKREYIEIFRAANKKILHDNKVKQFLEI